jgi:hypothetical protein
MTLSSDPTYYEARATQVGGDHYCTMTIQPWDAMQAWLTREQFEGFLLGNTIKYCARYNADAPTKGGVVDLKKARHYLDRLIELAETH